MRVTDSMMSSSYLRNLATNQKNVQKYNNQLSSMKEVSKPSDNPLLVSQIMNMKNSIIENEQYQTTIKDAIDWTQIQDSALSSATDAMMRISTLVQSAANGTMNESDRQAVKAEVEAEIHTLVDAMNTNFGGRYLFGGTDTATQPFTITKDEEGTITGITYNGNEETLSREVSSGVRVSLRTDGSKLLNGDGNGDDLGSLLANVVSALDTDDQKALGGDLLSRVNQEIDNIVTVRTEIGAVSNRLESAKARNENEELSLQSILSDKEDIDFAEKYMQFTMEKVAYQSSLQMGTRILQTNILDYLR